jgi:oxygen-dependent protoporphyrinogen oxidase
VRDAVVVGGGIAGLAAAWDLRNRDVLVLEASERVGGRIRSEPRDPYWLNLGAHVFPGPGSATGRLVADVGVESLPVPGHLVALELNGRLLVGGRPELYPLRLPLRPAERIALTRAGARLRLAVARYERVAKPRPGESPAETRRRLLAHGDDQTFSEWLGHLPGDADLMFRATVTRSTAEPEEITAGAGTGYFALVWSSGGGLSRNIVGGAGALVDGLAAELAGRIVRDAEVQEIAVEGELVRVRYREGGVDRQLRARHAIVATKAFDAARLVRDLPDDTRSSLNAIPYGPTVVMAMLTNETRPMPWDDLYALATPKRSFNMLFNTVNVLRPAAPCGCPAGA